MRTHFTKHTSVAEQIKCFLKSAPCSFRQSINIFFKHIAWDASTWSKKKSVKCFEWKIISFTPPPRSRQNAKIYVSNVKNKQKPIHSVCIERINASKYTFLLLSICTHTFLCCHVCENNYYFKICITCTVLQQILSIFIHTMFFNLR